ncbi:hypothetical protein [Lyngbya sp. PCC 8106]|uniref:hypothetical protein n=1 Tax=Lyngbya sp. (strain PCC 8106) TaxID=313612 RepID=UPI0000EA8FEF|nr:hypothetical protein [Lyngbya sp. PCC 8106]EAW35242.1 hypothetical protein L8106_15934 [Lyngbya sp. PCC 8106]
MSQDLIPNFPNVSLVAFYGKKSPEFTKLILELQQYLSKLLPGIFERYALESIHATLLGCEGVKTERGILSRWFLERREESRIIDFLGFLNSIQNCSQLPINIRFGGYQFSVDYGFTSRHKHPYERSFCFQNEIAVLMGWPMKVETIIMDIDNLRRSAENYNLLHKYHGNPDNIDNDCYLRIGILNSTISAEKSQEVEQKIQEYLRMRSPLELALSLEDLSFVQYNDYTLPLATTQVIPLQDATPKKLEILYPIAIENNT